MAQQQSPWLEGAYGWSFGEGGWNTGMDQNLLKFSFMFDRNVDSVVASLPSAVNGQSHYLTADNRLYFAVGTTYFSTPTPKWFEFKDRTTGNTYQFNGTSAVQIDSPDQLDTRIGDIELTVSSLGTAAFEDVEFFATQANLDVVSAPLQQFDTDLQDPTDPTKGADLVGYRGQTTYERLTLELTPQDFGAVGDGVTDDTVAWGNFIAASGSKFIPAGSYLVSGVVKVYGNPTFINTVNNNHGEGYLALESSTTGENNTAFGNSALRKTNGILPLGSNNVAIGYEALINNTEGYRNVAIGYQALHNQTGNLTTGNSNNALGYQALYNNTLGKDNTALGYLSMFFNTEGGGNTAVGYRALYSNVGVADTTGQFNTAMGYEVLLANTFGNSNTAYGWRGMFSNTTGTRNTSVGQEALRANLTGSNNVAVGYKASHASDAADTVAVGYQAMLNNTAALNVAVGKDAMLANTSGGSNTAVGYQALSGNTTASLCTAVGRGALLSSSGASNTALGYNALSDNSTFFNCTGIGAAAAVTGSNQVQLGDSATTTYVYGTVQNRSDLRDKIDVAETALGIDFIMGLRAVDGRWNLREDYRELGEDGTVTKHKNDGSKARTRRHQWFIAQEVEALCHKLGVDFGGLQHHEKDGGEDVYSLGYDEFIPPTVKAVQQCWSRMDELEARLVALESKG